MKIFKKQISILQIVEWFVIIASICFLFWRCKYGYCFNDEPLFITFAERLFNGDVLYADEWFVAQNVGITIYPFYRVFRLFNITNEGIILTFRYIYCSLWALTCLYVYKTFRKEYKLTIFVFLFLMLFQPLDYSSLSYTSISLMSSIIICCLLYKLPNKDIDGKYVIRYGLIFGLLMVILVLCVPLMAIPFFISVVLVIIINSHSTKKYFNNLKKILIISMLVCGISFFTYLFMLFFNAGTKQILYGVDKMLNSHSHMNMISLFNGAKSIYQEMPVLCLASTVTCLYSLIDREHKLVKYILFSICLLLYLYYVYKSRHEILNQNFNNQMLYISIVGFTSFFILEKKPVKLFVIFWFFSIIYVIFHGCLSSDTGLTAISMNLVVGSVAGLLCLTLLIKEPFYDFYRNYIYIYIVVGALCIATATTQLVYQLYVRLNRQYWDSNIKELTKEITKGSAKGIYTNQSQADWYEDHVYRLQSLLNMYDIDNKSFLCLTYEPVLYLESGLEYNTMSAWSFSYNKEELNETLREYYEIHNNNYPDFIFALNEEDIIPIVENGYKKTEGFSSYLFIKEE